MSETAKKPGERMPEPRLEIQSVGQDKAVKSGKKMPPPAFLHDDQGDTSGGDSTDDDGVKEASEESFPASDPPAWIAKKPKDKAAKDQAKGKLLH